MDARTFRKTGELQGGRKTTSRRRAASYPTPLWRYNSCYFAIDFLPFSGKSYNRDFGSPIFVKNDEFATCPKRKRFQRNFSVNKVAKSQYRVGDVAKSDHRFDGRFLDVAFF